MTTKRSFKFNLAVLMAKADIRSITELERKTGITRPTLTSIYNSETSRIDKDTLVTLCNFFDCTIGEFMSLVSQEEKEALLVSVEQHRERLRDGFVYFAKDPVTSLVKVGKSIDVEKRLYQLKQKYGSELQLLDVIKSSDANALEKEIHKGLDPRRAKGEWFILSEEEVEKVVKSIKET